MGNVHVSPARVKEKTDSSANSSAKSVPISTPDADHMVGYTKVEAYNGDDEPESPKVGSHSRTPSPATIRGPSRVKSPVPDSVSTCVKSPESDRVPTRVAPAVTAEPLPLSLKVMVEWRNEPQSVQHVARSMSRDEASAIFRAGQQAIIRGGDGTVTYISPELGTLAWAAKTFALRVINEMLMNAATDNFIPAFVPEAEDVVEVGCYPCRPRTAPSYLRMTTVSAKRVETVLRRVIISGDGKSMVGCAAKVEEVWPGYYRNMPALRALVWSARVLGRRFLDGDFGSRMTPEEEAMIAKARNIVKRVYQLPGGATLTPIREWRIQLAAVIEEVRAAPAPDGVPEAFASRPHLPELAKQILPTMAADLEGCDALEKVEVMPMTSSEIMKALDLDGNGQLDAEEIEASKIDLAPVYELEKAIEKAAKLPLPALFVPDSERIVKRRRIERALIEGVKENNASELRQALKDNKDNPQLEVARELVGPAEEVILRLEIEEALESSVAERGRAKIVAAIGRAEADGAPEVATSYLEAANAMLAKLNGFDECQKTMDAKAVDGLKEAIHHMNEGWWKKAHWYAEDKQQLHTYQLAYKRLSVLSELENYMEPLSVAFLQNALDTAIEVEVKDPLVDKAIEILKNIDRETVKAAFQRPLCAGGSHGGDSWTSNPQFRVVVRGMNGEEPPAFVKISITMVEGGDEQATGTQAEDYYGAFAVHVCRNKAGVESEEVLGDAEILAASEYDDDTTILTVGDVETASEFYIVASTKIEGEQGPFVINILCETPGADMDVARVVKTGDLVLQAIAADDLVELARLLELAKAKRLKRVHGTKGKNYLARRLKENALRAAVDAKGPVAALQEGLVGEPLKLGVPPSLVEQAEKLLARLLAIVAMEAADAEGAWEKLETAIASARTAKVEEPTIEPFLKRMLVLRAAARLRACLAKGEEGYTELQAMHDDGLTAGLEDADMAEAKRILDLIKDAQRHFNGKFESWMGGSKESGIGWVDNPQYKLTTADAIKMSVNVDKAGSAEFEAYNVHVVKPADQAAVQLGEAYEVVASAAYDAATSTLNFQAEAGAVYLVVPSTQETKMAGGFSITTIGIGKYTLEEVALVQVDIKAAMKESAFEKLPALIERAEGATVGLASHPLVISAKLISEIERGWQERNSAVMGMGMRNAKAAKVDKQVLKTYKQRYKQLAIEAKLTKGLAGDTALLLASYEEARLIGYSDGSFGKASETTGKFKQRSTIANLFMDDGAAGAPKFGNWRQNPTWKVTVSAKTTMYVALNEDGALDDAAKTQLDLKKEKKEKAYVKAQDKMASTAAAAAADEKNEELAAAAKDAARVFAEMDAERQLKAQRETDGEEQAFSALNVHMVRNTRESWIPGVLSGFQTMGAMDEYGDDQAFLAVEVDPADGSVFVVPSTFQPGEEGVFTLSLMADCAFQVEEVPEFEGNMIRLKGDWSTSNQGPRHKKNGGNEDTKNFKPEKTWNKNPQFRVWLKDPDEDIKHEQVGLQVVLSTPIEGAQIGMHVMRNTFCQFYNEKIEVLADRYQKLVAKTPQYEATSEIAFDIMLDDNFEVKKNGCESGFPFFIVPSLMDKKMNGPFQLMIYSDKPIVIQMLDDATRKL